MDRDYNLGGAIGRIPDEELWLFLDEFYLQSDLSTFEEVFKHNGQVYYTRYERGRLKEGPILYTDLAALRAAHPALKLDWMYCYSKGICGTLVNGLVK